MIWLAGQIWPFLLLSALLGAGLVVAFSTTQGDRRAVGDRRPPRRARRRSIPTTDEPRATRGGADRVGARGASRSPRRRSRSPLSGDAPAPWEQEELWSRPAKVVASRRPPADRRTSGPTRRRTGGPGPTRPPARSHDEPAETDEDRGRRADGGRRAGQPNPADRDLFAADREAEVGTSDPFPHAAARSRRSATTSPSTRRCPARTTPFPFARPVEAAPLPPTDPFPPFGGPPSAPATPAEPRPSPSPSPSRPEPGARARAGAGARAEPEPEPGPSRRSPSPSRA